MKPTLYIVEINDHNIKRVHASLVRLLKALDKAEKATRKSKLMIGGKK